MSTDDPQRAERIREIVRRLQGLQPDCVRRLLRQREVQEAVAQAEREAEAVLERDSVPFRLFDRMRRERTLWWEVHEYANPDDCEKLDSWVATLTTVVRELDPDARTPEEVNAELISEVEALRNLMVAVATGGPPIDRVNQDYQRRRERVSGELARRGLPDPNPYGDLWQ